jgi:putative PEP-CTERM system histidine kinase
MLEFLYGSCSAVYLVLSALILLQAKVSRTGLLLAAVAFTTACWALATAIVPFSFVTVALDLFQCLSWYQLALHIYRRSASGSELRQSFQMIGFVLGLVALVTLLLVETTGSTILPAGLLMTIVRLGLGVCTVLLLENLYLNTPYDLRWHINLPCICLGVLSIYNIALSADTLMTGRVSLSFFVGRAVITAIMAPLLAVAAARNRNWAVDIHVSRSVIFHSATLLISGIFLVSLGAAGELFRRMGADWGGVAQISLIFAGLTTIGVIVTSASARSRIRSLFVDHFFTHRYDYRLEWMDCINVLSVAGNGMPLHTRAIRALANVIDSSGGALMLRQVGEGQFGWAGSWNFPAIAAPLLPSHPLLPLFRGGDWIVEAGEVLGREVPGAWLAVPLKQETELLGFVLLGRPRAPFDLDPEVFNLLRIIGRQVASHVAEQQSSQALTQIRGLHEYGKRFAFVAHDIKNVAGQLTLLLSNAETHLHNPEFQQDMLATVRASVHKISLLLKRLQGPENSPQRATFVPLDRLEVLASTIGRARGRLIRIEHDESSGAVAMDPAAFDAAVAHLLNNAIEASAPDEPVWLSIQYETRSLTVDIIDKGPGMSPEFIRDRLFEPFATSKQDGSGIGAFQARELIREAGGDLLVLSRPGVGTTMRLLLPLIEIAAEPIGSTPY